MPYSLFIRLKSLSGSNLQEIPSPISSPSEFYLSSILVNHPIVRDPTERACSQIRVLM